MTRVCAVPGCAVLSDRTRCPGHERVYQQARNRQPARAAYQDPAYRRIPLGGVCWLCGQPGADTRDHVVALAAGGTNDPSNIRPAHRACNSRRGASTDG